MKTNLLQQNTKRVVAGLLVVWLSGVVFLFCCETSEANVSEAESCPLKKASHCNKKSTDETTSQIALLAAENHTIDCCRFPAQVFDKARKFETNQQKAKVSAIVKISPPEFATFKIKPHSTSFHQSVIRDRGSTFLRNCVFRI
jgi:hypothetical protein